MPWISDDVALAQLGGRVGLPAGDAVAPHGRKGHVGAARAHVVQPPAHRPGAGRQYDRAQLFAEGVGVVDDLRAVVPEHVAQRCVAAGADIADDAQHLEGGRLSSSSTCDDQHQAGLEGLGHDVGGARRGQLGESDVVLRAHQHRHVRAQPPHRAHDADRHGRIRKGDDHRAGIVDARLAQHLLVGTVAEQHRVAGLARQADAGRIEIERQVLEAQRFKHPRDVLADAAEAAQDHVLALRERAGGRGLALQRRRRRPALAQQQRARCARL